MVRVQVTEIREGCILSEDVLSFSKRTLIPKKTVLNSELISVLQAFLINEVEIEKTLVDGLPLTQDQKSNQESNILCIENEETLFNDLFLQATSYYKKEFKNWQAGAPVDVSKIRGILIPLVEHLAVNEKELFQLRHYSTVEDYLYQHAIAVGLFSGYIARKLGYSKGEVMQVALAGCLSDCGMAKVSENILFKKAALNEEEFNEIRKHSTLSYRLIQQSPLIREAGKVAIFQHHERLDGSGYPLGEKAEKIHPYAKIIAVADIFHAMTSERLYRSKQSPFKVVEMLGQDLFGQFDIASVHAIQSGLTSLNIGSRVMLSNGLEAEVLFIDEASPTRPLVRVIRTNMTIHLSKDMSIFILDIIL